MNITHLRYAVEVEKAKSINKAAENLYMGQPNLSRAIRELEEELGITIFNRSSRGMTITPEGEEFLSYAHRILEQVSEVEAIYKTKKHDRQYVCRAFLQQSLFPGSGERLHNGALQFLLHMVVLRNLRQFHHGLPDLIGDVFFFRLSVFLPLDAGAFPQIDFRRDFSALF